MYLVDNDDDGKEDRKRYFLLGGVFSISIPPGWGGLSRRRELGECILEQEKLFVSVTAIFFLLGEYLCFSGFLIFLFLFSRGNSVIVLVDYRWRGGGDSRQRLWNPKNVASFVERYIFAFALEVCFIWYSIVSKSKGSLTVSHRLTLKCIHKKWETTFEMVKSCFYNMLLNQAFVQVMVLSLRA